MIEEEEKELQDKKKKVNPQDIEAAKTPTALREVSTEKFEKFCLAENELNTSFCNNFAAVLLKLSVRKIYFG